MQQNSQQAAGGKADAHRRDKPNLDVNRGLVAYHLMALQERGFVKSDYNLLILPELEQTRIFYCLVAASTSSFISVIIVSQRPSA